MLALRISALVLCCGVMSACQARTQDASTIPLTVGDTSLGPGDVFEIRVFGEEQLSNSYRVNSDGTIQFPLIGMVEVAGLEPAQAANRIETELRERDLLLNPQVSILVSEYNSKRISVIGAVENPGTFPLTEGLTVVQAITLAGGFTNLANKNATVLTRRVGDETEKYTLAVGDMSRGRERDIPVGAGDIIYVPERAF
ncbi:MAG: polysaccharide biosynthesis/export family protein [Polyangiales bacterium]